MLTGIFVGKKIESTFRFLSFPLELQNFGLSRSRHDRLLLDRARGAFRGLRGRNEFLGVQLPFSERGHRDGAGCGSTLARPKRSRSSDITWKNKKEKLASVRPRSPGDTAKIAFVAFLFSSRWFATSQN